MKYILAMITVMTISASSGANEVQGLKRVNLKNQTLDQGELPSAGDAGTLTPEQAKKLQEDIETIKKNQASSEKILKELEENE